VNVHGRPVKHAGQKCVPAAVTYGAHTYFEFDALGVRHQIQASRFGVADLNQLRRVCAAAVLLCALATKPA
jgi:hypothetical protein